MKTEFLSAHIPWHALVGPGVVENYDLSLMKTYEFRGPDITPLTLDERLQRCERISRLFKQLGSRWSWLIDGQNVEVTGYPKTRWPTAASALMDAERESMIAKVGKQFVMKRYITLQQRPSLMSTAAAVLSSTPQMSERQRQLAEFPRQVAEFVKHLSHLVEIRELDDDETVSYLKSTVSTRRQALRASDHPHLSVNLADERFVRGIGWDLSSLGKQFLSVCTLGSFPLTSHPQMLAALERLPFEFRATTRWVSVDRATAKNMMTKQEEKALGRGQFFKDAIVGYLEQKFDKKKQAQEKVGYQRYDREAVGLADEAGSAMTSLDKVGYGHLSTTICIWDPSERRCKDKRLQMCEALSDFVIRSEVLEPFRPWRMTFPGNTELGRRTFLMSTRNLADFMPSSSIWQGRSHDLELEKTTGVRRPWMYTADPVPFRINTDVPGGAAHTLVFGATGEAGKSTFTNQMCLQFLGWPDAQIISISVGRSELGPVIMSDGAVYSIGQTDSLAFQPLAFVNEQSEAIEAMKWLQLCVEATGEKMTPERTEKLSEAIKLLAGDDQNRRTMTALVTNLKKPAPDLALILKPYTRSGFYGHIFDGDDVEAVKRKRWTMFDVSALVDMQASVVVPAMSHLMHRIKRWFDGRPTLVPMDEFPKLLGEPALEGLAINILDTRRKDNVRIMLVAQTPGQLAPYKRLMASVLSGCATTFYGPDSKARRLADGYRMMGLSDGEIDRVASLKLGSYMLKNEHGTREFDLRSGPIALALCGMSRPSELTQLAELRRKCSDGEEVMNELLRRKGLTAEVRRYAGAVRRQEEAQRADGDQSPRDHRSGDSRASRDHADA